MKKLLMSFVIMVLFSVGGCASLHKPTMETFSKIPIVQFGEAVPTNGEFILHFPAGKPIPMIASVKGSALSREDESTLNVSLKKDLYAYKHWVSFDRKTWQQSEDALDFKFDIKIPSPEYPKPGLMGIQVDLK